LTAGLGQTGDFGVGHRIAALHPLIASGGDQHVTPTESGADRYAALVQAAFGLLDGDLEESSVEIGDHVVLRSWFPVRRFGVRRTPRFSFVRRSRYHSLTVTTHDIAGVFSVLIVLPVPSVPPTPARIARVGALQRCRESVNGTRVVEEQRSVGTERTAADEWRAWIEGVRNGRPRRAEHRHHRAACPGR
jgi:hypothetical protein